jgi:hypothetical protein
MSSCATDLASLAGLDHAKRAVERVLASSSGVHAVMFYGAEGAGKSQLARVLAKGWLCPRPLPSGMPCDECNVCKSFDNQRAVDFLCIKPWGPQRLIKVSAIHETEGWAEDKDRPPYPFVLDFFRTRPLMGRHKVVVFEDADRMNGSAANAFLKTLEEPAESAKIVLTTSEFARVMPTVRSRCMCVACELPMDGGWETDAERVFGRSPGGVAHVREHRELFERLFDLMERTRTEPWGSAFRLAEQCREIAEDYAKKADVNARSAQAKVLGAVGAWLAQEAPHRPEALKSLAKTHRRVLGNAQAPIAFESLFLDLLYHG